MASPTPVTMRRSARWLSWALLTAALATGCGKSETEQIRETFARYDQARERGDEKTACAALTKRLQEDVIATQQRTVQATTCEGALNSTATPVPQGPIRAIELNENEAYARSNGQAYTGATGPGHLRLVKQDGEWKIQEFSPGP